jgi:hypothetical protein
MSRGASSGFNTAAGARVVYPAFFVEFQFDSGTTRFWTGDANISADLGGGSVTWTGGSTLGTFSFSGEGESIQARSMDFSISGVDKAYYSTAIATEYRNRPVKVWIVLLDSVGAVVDYYLLEEGRMDHMTIQEGDMDIRLSLKCESKLVNMFRPRRVFLSDFDHKKEYPDDDFYQFVTRMPGNKVPWGLENSKTWDLSLKGTKMYRRPIHQISPWTTHTGYGDSREGIGGYIPSGATPPGDG